MKRVLVIGNEVSEGDTADYYGQYQSFFEESAQHASTDIEIDWTLLQDILIVVGDGEFCVRDTKSGDELSEFDALIIRGTGFREQFDVLKAISAYAHLNSVPVINDYRAFRDSSKLGQAVQFFEHNLPVARTTYVNRAAMTDTTIAFPCVMKAVFGAHGNDNYVVESMDEVRAIAERSPHRFVLQRFVPNNGDYRVLVAGGSVRVIERKAVSGSHLNNTSQGGSAQLIDGKDLPNGIIEDSIRIARKLDMSIAGVDALIDTSTGAYYFLEVNSQPQLMTGAFIEEKEQLIGSFFDELFSSER